MVQTVLPKRYKDSEELWEEERTRNKLQRNPFLELGGGVIVQSETSRILSCPLPLLTQLYDLMIRTVTPIS
jgi:hypothetical protein